jgi:hypothetical protein
MSPIRFLTFAAIPFLLAAAPDRVPELDVRSTCRSSGTVQNGSADACLNAELGAKKELARDWTKIPAAVRQSCTDEVRIGGSPSYVELLTCAQMNEWRKASAGTAPSEAATAPRRP